MPLNVSCIPLSAVRLDFVDVLSPEDTRAIRSTGKQPPDFWSVEVTKAKTYEEYERTYNDIYAVVKETAFEFGEKKTLVSVYSPDVLEDGVSNDTYVLYTWMLLNLLCPLAEHPNIKFKFKFNLGELIDELSKHSPELPKWFALRRDNQLFEAPLHIDGQPRILETKCNRYNGAYRYINSEFVGEVFFNLFPTHNPNWFYLERALFANEADSVHFVLSARDKWNKLVGNK